MIEVTYQYNRPHVVLLDPVLPPPAAVLGLGHDGGNLHAVAATGPWGPHGILTGTSDPVLSPPACLPCHGGSLLHALTGGIHYNQSLTRFIKFFRKLHSNAFTTSGPQPWQFVYPQTLSFFSVTKTLG